MIKSFKNITPEVLSKDVASYIVSLIPNNTIFLFDGTMGAGKTTLISAVCQLLKTNEMPSSPTYSIVNTYYSNLYGEIFHFDFYRISNENEALESGLDEMIYSKNICFIEWSEKIAKLLPKNYVRININVISTNERNIFIHHT